MISHCGRRLHVTYSGANGYVPRYGCRGAAVNHGTGACIPFGGPRVDEAIEREVLRVLSPGAVEAALATAVTIDEEGAACGALDQAPGRAAHHPGRGGPAPAGARPAPRAGGGVSSRLGRSCDRAPDEEAPRPCAPGDRGDHREGWGSRRSPRSNSSFTGRAAGTDAGNTWTQSRVISLRSYHHIPAFDPAVDRLHLVTVATAAKVLGVSAPTVRRMMARGFLAATQRVAHAPWAIREDDLRGDAVRQAVELVKRGGALPRTDQLKEMTFENSTT